MFVQAGGIISSNIYRKDDAPNYKHGNRTLLGIAVGNIGIYLLTKAYYVWRNKSREKKWNAMTQEQQLEYLETTSDEGNKRVSQPHEMPGATLTTIVGLPLRALGDTCERKWGRYDWW